MSATQLSSAVDELPVHIVEDHDGALPLIYRAIGAKKLPFSGVALIHFDAHPDLLSPNVQADECLDKEKLFAYTSIAEWILPAVYMEHVGCVVWLKPPWASQIPDGVYQLCVGKDCKTGHIRIATPLPYFISELLYVPKSDLVNCTTVPLHVITVRPTAPLKERHGTIPVATGSATSLTGQTSTCRGDDTQHCPQQEAGQAVHSCSLQCDYLPPAMKKPKISDPSTSARRVAAVTDCATRDQTSSSATSNVETWSAADNNPVSHSRLQERAVSQLSTVIESVDAWVLDVDLDFFSTGNPFSSAFTQEQYEHMRKLYQFSEPERPDSPNSVARCAQQRKQQLDSLKELWSGDCSVSEDALCSGMVQKIRAIIGTVEDGAVITAEDVHLAGMMTDLPEHISTDQEVSDLAVAVHELLKQSCSQGRKPSMITIARSTVDDYTPPSQVDFIQTLTVAMLGELYGSLQVQRHYTSDNQCEQPESSDCESTDSELV